MFRRRSSAAVATSRGRGGSVLACRRQAGVARGQQCLRRHRFAVRHDEAAPDRPLMSTAKPCHSRRITRNKRLIEGRGGGTGRRQLTTARRFYAERRAALHHWNRIDFKAFRLC